MKRKTRNTGFTLLEVIVSLVILTVALTAIITVGSNRAETLIELRQQNRALMVANNVLETTDNKYAKQLATFIINTKRGIPFIRKEK